MHSLNKSEFRVFKITRSQRLIFVIAVAYEMMKFKGYEETVCPHPFNKISFNSNNVESDLNFSFEFSHS